MLRTVTLEWMWSAFMRPVTLPLGSGFEKVASDECFLLMPAVQSTSWWKVSRLPISDHIKKIQLILAHSLTLIRVLSAI